MILKVKVKKVHQKYSDLFPIDDVVELYIKETPFEKTDTIKSNVDGNLYPAQELCKAFSNHCSYSDLFDKV